MMNSPVDYAALSDAALAELDARLSARDDGKWQGFYVDRAKPVPFFGLAPDENLHAWVRGGEVTPGPALDLGCGNGRNSIFLAKSGFDVDAVDLSPSAVAWAEEEAAKAGVTVDVRCGSVFELPLEPESYHLVYDSGCFHHIAPHRRHQYVALVAQALRPGGVLGLVCFAPEGGSGLSDEQVYQQGSLGGGLGYDEDRLREIWSASFEIDSVRRMHAHDPGSDVFGRSELWALLARRR